MFVFLPVSVSYFTYGIEVSSYLFAFTLYTCYVMLSPLTCLLKVQNLQKQFYF